MITLRPGRFEDAFRLTELLAACEMSGDIDPGECLVAEGVDGPVGFARLEWADSVPYLRPIAVAPAWRHHGIGRSLVASLLANLDELRVVARGEAVAFYTGLGFRSLDWPAVYAPYRQECVACPDGQACNPVPLKRTRSVEV